MKDRQSLGWLRRARARSLVVAHDLMVIPVAWLGAYWLRFNLETIPEEFLGHALAVLPLVVLIQGGVFWYFGLYRGVWRFASIPDLMRIIRAVAIGVALSAVALFLLNRVEGVPRSVFLIYGLLLVILLGGPRLLYRWFKDRALHTHIADHALIVGAGRGGELLVRDLRRDPSHACLPAAFVDDDPAKQGKDILGVRVIGTVADVPRLVETHDISLIIIAVPSATQREMQQIVEMCEQTRVSLRTMPRFGDLVTGHAIVSQLHDVSIEDLLGRDPVSLDCDSLRTNLTGKRVLVTGGGGSIGSELCRQIARLEPAELIILEATEYFLYRIGRELEDDFPSLKVRSHLGDVCDQSGVQWLMERYEPEVVFHAAAYKHVPVLENQVREALRNNLLGTAVVAEEAMRHDVGTFVLISTDKAVNPVNVMGATKRAAEIVCQYYGFNASTRFITVRFGNVLGSAGSVVPLFRRQIDSGGPVTVTHPDITRYFMTIPEASQLILQAAVMGRGGEVFVLDMGEPVKIQYLAEQMIRLAGKVPYDEIDVVSTGLRPGEKLYEELFHEDERVTGTGHDKILLARSRPMDEASVRRTVEEIRNAIAQCDEGRLADLLRQLVPEFMYGASSDREGAKVIAFPEPGEAARQEHERT